ncbi:MAG: siphovirus Gp157 family protein [Burkholderiales bacterium]|nr:siphovirus Gp157 family protein [Burkholderiales bacterium]
MSNQALAVRGPSLFEVAAQYRDDIERLLDLDLDEQTLADTLDSLGGELQVKAQNTVMAARSLEALAEAMGREMQRMEQRRKAVQARAASLRRYIMDAMQLAGVKRIECPAFRIRTQANPASVEVFDPDQVPDAYRRQAAPPPPEISKSAIHDAIKLGVEVPGARLVKTSRLVIE